jgi:hypothetical protein
MMRSFDFTLSDVKPVGLMWDPHEGRHIHCRDEKGVLGPLIGQAKAVCGSWEGRFNDVHNL